MSTTQDLLQEFAKLVAAELHKLQTNPAPSDEEAKLKSTGEIAEIFGYHPQTLREWRLQGCPAEVSPGGKKIRWNLAKVRAWLATRDGAS